MKVAFLHGVKLETGAPIRSRSGKDYTFIGLHPKHNWVIVHDPDRPAEAKRFVYAYSVFNLEVRDE